MAHLRIRATALGVCSAGFLATWGNEDRAHAQARA